jgi:hypothetical protein
VQAPRTDTSDSFAELIEVIGKEEVRAQDVERPDLQ